MPEKPFAGRKKTNTKSTAGHTVDRWISKLGLGTHGMAREWVRQGRLAFEDGRQVESVEQFVRGKTGCEPVFRLDGRTLLPDSPAIYAFNKPRGLLVTRTDPEGRETISERVALSSKKMPGLDVSRIMPVGRLDQASSGLILLTNRPSALSGLLDPERDFLREYRVKIHPALKRKDWDTGLAGGGWANALGFRSVEVQFEKENLRSTWLKVGLREGKNREIRRLFDIGGYEVLHLVRVRFGPFCLKDLPPGGILDVSRFFLRDGLLVLDIILDMMRSGDIIELKESGAVVSQGGAEALRKK